jgi:acyl-CoA thioesterase YciA
VADGRIVTVAINGMVFLTPVHVGAVLSCYTDIIEVGRSSIKVNVEVWIKHKKTSVLTKVTEGEFVVVAIDGCGKSRAISDD